MTSTLSRSNATGRATRERLLITAEELFGRRGIDAVTLKEIGDASGQRNKVVTQYHFGDKDGLIAAIVEYRYPRIHRSQRALLDTATAAVAGPRDVRTLARVMVVPAAEQVREGNWFVPFLARLYADWTSRLRFVAANPAMLEMHATMGRALRAAMPEVPPRRFAQRYTLCTTLVLQALSDQQLAMVAGEAQLPLEDYVEDLVRMVAGALIGVS
jgi:AcrR family transcriptional regulator